MYMPSQSSISPVHSFGTVPEKGPHRFGMQLDSSSTPHSFTGGGVPRSSQPGDMGNVLTHKQSARVVIQPYNDKKRESYTKQVDTLVEKEFAVIASSTATQHLSPVQAPGDHAQIVSLAYLNHCNHEGENCPEPLVSPMPFGPVIQTEMHAKGAKPHQRGVTNVAIGGRADFANCFIRTQPDTSKSPVICGDGVYIASFLFVDMANAKYTPYHFLLIDNDYSFGGDDNDKDVTKWESIESITEIKELIDNCTKHEKNANTLCQIIVKAFKSPGTQHPLDKDTLKNISCTCTFISCVGTIIMNPIPNKAYEDSRRILLGMINEEALMSTTHPVVVQMSS